MAATPGRLPWRHRSHHHARWRAPADALLGAGLLAAQHPAQPRRALRSRHRPAQARRAAGTGAERDANHRRAPGESLSADQPQHRAGCRAAGGRHGAACADRFNDLQVYYAEYRSHDKSDVKVYWQKKTVDYADYRVGRYYISPFDLVDGEDKDLIDPIARRTRVLQVDRKSV